MDIRRRALGSEWLAAMRDVKRKVNPNGYAILMPTNEWEHLSILGLQTGSQLLRDDGRFANFDTPEFRQAFEFYASVVRRGLAPVVTNDTNCATIGRNLAAAILRCTSPGHGISANFDGVCRRNCKTIGPPRRCRGRMVRSSAFRKRVAAGWRFSNSLSIKRLPGDWSNFSRAGAIGTVLPTDGQLATARIGLETGPDRSDPPVSAFHEQFEHVVPLPRVPEWEMIATTQIARAVQAVVAHEQTVDEAIADLDRRVNDVLEKRRWLLARHDSRQN